MAPRKPSPTDRGDKEGARLTPLVPGAKRGGRPVHDPKRGILNGLCSIGRGGAWRPMPHDLPPWQLVYQDCWRWRQDGPWPRLPDVPSAGRMERQSVTPTGQGGSGALTPVNGSQGATASSTPSGGSSRSS